MIDVLCEILSPFFQVPTLNCQKKKYQHKVVDFNALVAYVPYIGVNELYALWMILSNNNDILLYRITYR